MSNFLQTVADVLEVESIALDDRFREVPDWSSLKAFGLMVTLENDYGAPVRVEGFRRLESVRDLYLVAFAAFAAELLGVERDALDGGSGMGTAPGWDSVMQLRMVMEAEKRFGCVYPLEVIPALANLDAFAGRVRFA